jgi:formylglycine-generating enzyme required for sulfatase activity
VWWDDTDFNNPSQPVVGVSWYEARAYCAWLAHCLGHEVRLPTEVEWERAARGPYGWPRPWGKDFDVDQANTVEGRVRRTSPVGVYPAGASFWGVHDLAGNVWEWTLSVWGEDYNAPTTGQYPYDPDDGRENISAPVTEARVVRGGAWYFDGKGASCAVRYRHYPAPHSGTPFGRFRDHHRGFRVACAHLHF